MVIARTPLESPYGSPALAISSPVVTPVSVSHAHICWKYTPWYYQTLEWPYFRKETSARWIPFEINSKTLQIGADYSNKDQFRVKYRTCWHNHRHTFNSISVQVVGSEALVNKRGRHIRKGELGATLFLYFLLADTELSHRCENELGRRLSKRISYERINWDDAMKAEKGVYSSWGSHNFWGTLENIIKKKYCMKVGKEIEASNYFILDNIATEKKYYFLGKPVSGFNSKNSRSGKPNIQKFEKT